MTMRRHLLRLYVGTVVLASIAAMTTLPVEVAQKAALAVLVALALVVGSRAVHLPRLRLRVTLADAFIYCALASGMPLAAPLVALASVVGAEAAYGRRRLSIRTLFNLGGVTLSATAATWAFLGLGGAQGAAPAALVPALAAALVFFVTNVFLTAVAIHLEKGSGFVRVWKSSAGWVFVSSVTSLLAGMGLLLVLTSVGPLGLVAGLAPATCLDTYVRVQGRRASRLEGQAAVVAPAQVAAA
jgi:hypothetical protein